MDQARKRMGVQVIGRTLKKGPEESREKTPAPFLVRERKGQCYATYEEHSGGWS